MGHLPEHLKRMQTLYLSRKNVVMSAAGVELSNLMEVRDDDEGLHRVGWLAEENNVQVLCQHLRAHDVPSLPVSLYSESEVVAKGLLVGFGFQPEEEIKERYNHFDGSKKGVSSTSFENFIRALDGRTKWCIIIWFMIRQYAVLNLLLNRGAYNWSS